MGNKLLLVGGALLLMLIGGGVLTLAYYTCAPWTGDGDERAAGVVTGIVDQHRKSAHYFPQVEFVDDENQHVVATAAEVAWWKTFTPGEKVTVRYTSGEPEQVRIESWRALLNPGFFIAAPIGLAFAGAGLFTLLAMVRK